MEGTGSSPVAGWMMRILAMMNREDWNIPPRFVQRSGKPVKKPGLKSVKIS